MKDSIHVVIWSGGFDSTLVLDQVCSVHPAKCIWAFSIDWDMLDDLKTEKEKEVRKKYLSFAKGKGYNIAHQTIKVTADMGATDLGCAQGLAWFSFIMPYLPENSIVYLGYHSGDILNRVTPEFDNYVKAAEAIGDRKIELRYPLQYKSKYDIIEETNSRIPLSCVWTCEKPRKRNKKIICCGRCNPCINLKVARYESKLRKGTNLRQ